MQIYKKRHICENECKLSSTILPFISVNRIWPDLQHDVYKEEEVFCYALRNQIGVLADGTVVPCCLDHNGDMPLGNLYDNSLNEILASPRATALYHGFTSHTAVEPLCQRCGYSAVSKRFRKQE